VTGEEFRAAALALPDAVEKETWGEATFRVREKIFAMMDPDGGGASVKAGLEDQAELIAGDPETFRPASHVGRYGWVAVTLARADAAEITELLAEAWRRTAPKKLVRGYDGAP
jgi:hypothetical protein